MEAIQGATLLHQRELFSTSGHQQFNTGPFTGNMGNAQLKLMVLPPPTAAGAAQITISVILRAKHSIAGAPPTSEFTGVVASVAGRI
jgi:hypothetical protein